MATLGNIVAGGLLEYLKVPLDPGEVEERCICVTPHATEWLSGTLPGLSTSIAGGRMDPLEQASEFFLNFLTGGKFTCEGGLDLHEMDPVSDDVWELKTIDIRMFGWFYKPNIFICVSIDSKDNLETQKAAGINIYGYKRNGVVGYRDTLDIDLPKIATAQDVKNELCF